MWDGDQVLLERRANGASGLTSGQLDQETSSGEAWGEVVSLHANGIDAPIAVRKNGRTTVAPYANWQGDYEIGTTADGTPTSSCSGTTTCPVIQWPGSVENADGLIVDHGTINTWWGSLITEKLDASGLKYMRNRYYNPQTGQFTQPDPIGLAGGLNLYGFAGGDPVNFGDPFGLCTPWPECLLQGAANWGARRGGELGSSVVIGAAAANAASEAFGLNDVGRAIADRDAAGGVIALASILPIGKMGKAAKLALSEQLLGEAIAGAGTRRAIAGAGTAATLRDARRLTAQHGGELGDWAKMVGRSIKSGDGHVLQIHWYENVKTGLRTEFKHNLP